MTEMPVNLEKLEMRSSVKPGSMGPWYLSATISLNGRMAIRFWSCDVLIIAWEERLVRLIVGSCFWY